MPVVTRAASRRNQNPAQAQAQARDQAHFVDGDGETLPEMGTSHANAMGAMENRQADQAESEEELSPPRPMRMAFVPDPETANNVCFTEAPGRGGSGTPGDSPGTHGELVPRACREVTGE